MTAVGGASDAELVERVRAGDRDAFGQVYERYADRLFDFAHGMLRQREDAADAVADSFVTMAERLDQLRDPSRLRPWLYAVVRRECLRRLKARSRVAFGDDDQLEALPDVAASPEDQVESADLGRLVWEAAAGLGERDRALLDLHLRHGLEGQELADALGITASNAYTSLNRLKTQVERSLGALLIARLGRDDCRELQTVLAGWDGTFTVLMRKRVARHVDGCLVCDERRAALTPLALFAGVPLLVAPSSLRDRVLGDVRLVGHLTDGPSAAGAASGVTGGGPVAAGGVRRRWLTRVLPTVAVLALVVGGGTLLVLDRGDDTDRVVEDAAVLGTTSAAPTALPSLLPSPDPLELAPTPSAVAPSASATPTVAPTSAAPTSTAPVPGLVADPAQLDLGDKARAGTVRLTSVVAEPLDYAWSTTVPWLVLPQAGTLGPGESTAVLIYVDRAQLPAGVSEAVVTVSWAGGSLPVTVLATGPAQPSDGGTIVAPGTTAPENL
ncbi:MAG: sigma-70 family RNA polymerase sigma factor [Nocardioidaceae bacterium]|nr:sigma-70 family RNA polymerase sigma factor [Nocardioidaceae bacterium]